MRGNIFRKTTPCAATSLVNGKEEAGLETEKEEWDGAYAQHRVEELPGFHTVCVVECVPVCSHVLQKGTRARFPFPHLPLSVSFCTQSGVARNIGELLSRQPTAFLYDTIYWKRMPYPISSQCIFPKVSSSVQILIEIVSLFGLSGRFTLPSNPPPLPSRAEPSTQGRTCVPFLPFFL